MGFPGTGKIWMNGKLVDWKDANIHIATHVIHYGSGVFEGARCYATPKGSACFRLEPHMRRLMESAKIYRMEYSLDLQGWMNAVLDTIRVNEMKACYIRPLVYRGYETLGVNPLANPVDAAIMVWDWGAYLGAGALEDGVDVKVSSWTRMAPNTLPAMAKSTANYANSALIKMEAVVDGYSGGDCARRQRQPERRQRPEPLPRPRRPALHAAARARRFSAASRATRSSRSRARPATPSPRPCCRASRSTRPTRCSLRHGRRSHAGALGGQDQSWYRKARICNQGAPDRVFQGHQRRSAGSARLADLRLSGRKRPFARAPQSRGVRKPIR